MSQNCNVRNVSGRFVSALGLVLALLSVFGSDVVEGRGQLSSLTNGKDPTNLLRRLRGTAFLQLYAEMRRIDGGPDPCNRDVTQIREEQSDYIWNPSNTWKVTPTGVGYYDFRITRNYIGCYKEDPANCPEKKSDSCRYTASSNKVSCDEICGLNQFSPTKVQLSSLTNGQDPTNLLRDLSDSEFTQVFVEMRTRFGSPCDGDLNKYQNEVPSYDWVPSNTNTVTRTGFGYDFTLKRSFIGYSRVSRGNQPLERFDECSYTARSDEVSCAFCFL